MISLSVRERIAQLRGRRLSKPNRDRSCYSPLSALLTTVPLLPVIDRSLATIKPIRIMGGSHRHCWSDSSAGYQVVALLVQRWSPSFTNVQRKSDGQLFRYGGARRSES